MDLGFQEYIAAEEIRNKNRVELLLDNYGNRWRREVALLALALDNPSMISPFMERIVQKDVFKTDITLVCMAGNAWEWCADRYDDNNDKTGKRLRGTKAGSNRVMRGGSWDNDAFLCRAGVLSLLQPPGQPLGKRRLPPGQVFATPYPGGLFSSPTAWGSV